MGEKHNTWYQERVPKIIEAKRKEAVRSKCARKWKVDHMEEKTVKIVKIHIDAPA